MSTEKFITEAITSESELIAKLSSLSERDIFEFMQNLRGGTYFNMGMFSSIKPAKAYNKTTRIYKVLNMTAVVSGVSYENIGTTKEFRDRTGKAPGKSWYSHVPGFENKVGQKNSDPSSKYVLWDIKAGTDTWVKFFVVDIATGDVKPLSKDSILESDYLTPSEKSSLIRSHSTGFDKETGELIENQTNWRTAKFENIFWLSQAGKGTKEYGTKFTESLKGTKDKKVMNRKTLRESAEMELFRDGHAGVTTDLDAILSGGMVESVSNATNEDYSHLEPFECEHCGKTLYGDDYRMLYNDEYDYDEVVCHDCYNKAELSEPKGLKEAADDKVTIRCANAHYEDDDGYPCNVGIYAGDLSFDELTDILYDAGMLYVDVFGEYEREIEARFASSYKPGQVVDVFDADEEFVKDFIETNGLDPEDYEHIGFFEGKTSKVGADKLEESYRRIITVDHSLVDNELFVEFE